MMNDPTGLAGMIPFDSIGLYEQPKPRFIFKMPKVVPDQKTKFESDDLFKKLSRESEVNFYFFKFCFPILRKKKFKLILRFVLLVIVTVHRKKDKFVLQMVVEKGIQKLLLLHLEQMFNLFFMQIRVLILKKRNVILTKNLER